MRRPLAAAALLALTLASCSSNSKVGNRSLLNFKQQSRERLASQVVGLLKQDEPREVQTRERLEVSEVPIELHPRRRVVLRRPPLREVNRVAAPRGPGPGRATDAVSLRDRASRPSSIRWVTRFSKTARTRRARTSSWTRSQ